ncbi:16S rRNA (uracil(1498)-N(3))-methyltransferase [Candidatus Pseudomonas adelgestsugas]|uniref:Ribosomal RNA small subunit methyltransferase E n=1 Tax=Candidatus Pseudomonas adelgestsugas TaxID=1302376 RepID=A0ABX5R7Y1_9PSED|nr:16S rRNA (uracil(1498)-N(3))-methyltransferase [Candidatus Pseudomonas adelgestsugas]QAX81464.1 Ribosomal RNA small subunit methyltransferase E [Candidatus Pseudomonas adelgestsugas]
MRFSRFFTNIPLNIGNHELPEALAYYISRVLRKRKGDTIRLFDGSGQEFLGILLEVGKQQVTVQLTKSFAGQTESPLYVYLGQGLSRSKRMDWAIQKATELGVNEITPIFSERCEIYLKGEHNSKRLLHWRQIAISACEQCGRSTVPVILPPLLLIDWLKQTEADLKLTLHPVAEPMTSYAKPASIAFLIGPAGGLTDTEIKTAQGAGFHTASLGPRILRTETTPVVALAVAQQLWGDF